MPERPILRTIRPPEPKILPCLSRNENPGLIRVRGADARAFLHAQTTQDMAALAAGTTRPAAWLSAKGRVRALFDVVADGEDFWLIGPADDGEYLQTELARYVLRADVRIEPARDFTLLSLCGADDAWLAAHTVGLAPKRASEVAPEVVPEPGPEAAPKVEPEPAPEVARDFAVGTVRRGGDTLFARTGSERIAVIAPAGPRPAALAAVPACDADRDALAAIAEGRAEIPPKLRERYVPQMLNLDRIGAVSFTKGCYPGQEIVARTQNLGSVKRRLRRYALAPGERPAPGDAIVDANGEPAGEVNRVAATGAGFELLAVTPVEAPDGGLVLARDGRPLEPQALADDGLRLKPQASDA